MYIVLSFWLLVGTWAGGTSASPCFQHTLEKVIIFELYWYYHINKALLNRTLFLYKHWWLARVARTPGLVDILDPSQSSG